MSMHPHRETTTTHATWGAGNPRLLISDGGVRTVFDLVSPLTRIGSALRNELVLEGADPVHATVQHTERDEYVLTMHGPGETSSIPAAQPNDGVMTPPSITLRTGARFTTGPWTLVYVREEFADHGRPFGGRQGGELSDQPPQPTRPDYTRPLSEQFPRPLEVQDD